MINLDDIDREPEKLVGEGLSIYPESDDICMTVDYSNRKAKITIPLELYTELLEYKGRYLELKERVPYYYPYTHPNQPTWQPRDTKITCYMDDIKGKDNLVVDKWSA